MDERILTIRIPGHAVGVIKLNSSWIITDIVIDEYDILKGVFSKDIHQKLSKFIGKKIVIEFTYSMHPPIPKSINEMLVDCVRANYNGNDIWLGKQCKHEYILYRFTEPLNDAVDIAVYKYYLNSDKTLVTNVKRHEEFSKKSLTNIRDVIFNLITKNKYLPIKITKSIG